MRTFPADRSLVSRLLVIVGFLTIALSPVVADAEDERIAACKNAAQQASIPPRSALVMSELVTRAGTGVVHLSWDDMVGGMGGRRDHHFFECVFSDTKLIHAGPRPAPITDDAD